MGRVSYDSPPVPVLPARLPRQLRDEAEQALSSGDGITSPTSSLCGDDIDDDIYESLPADDVLDEVNVSQAK